MVAGKDLNEVTFNHLTEACPQMTRRFRTGAAAEFAAWLYLHRRRAQSYYDSLTKPDCADGAAWYDGSRAWLRAKISAINVLIAMVADRFPAVEWSTACEMFQRVLDTVDRSDEGDTPYPNPELGGEGG